MAETLERLMGLGHRRVRTGPRDPGQRLARICYDHLADETGVGLHEARHRDGALTEHGGAAVLTGRVGPS